MRRCGFFLFLLIVSLFSCGSDEKKVPGGSSLEQGNVTGLIVADHTIVDEYINIPDYWISEVKKMWVNIPGESHSSGYRIGLQLLMNQDPKFQVVVTDSGDPEPYREDALRISRAVRTAYSSWGYGTGEGQWYTGYVNSDGSPNVSGLDSIKNHITYSNNNGLEIAAIGFGWCWDMTWINNPGGDIDPVYQVRWAGASDGGPNGNLRWGLDSDDYLLTGNRVSLDTYLNATLAYRDHAVNSGFPTVVMFTTGPVDGGDNMGENGYQRWLKHEQIRSFAGEVKGVLFDYGDILCWGDDGTQQTTQWTDYGGTARTYQHIHDDNMLDLIGTYAEDGDHIGERGALRVGKAIWWVLARIAGWDGTSR